MISYIITNATTKIIGPHYAEFKVRKNDLNDIKSIYFFSKKGQRDEKSQFHFSFEKILSQF